MQTIDTTVFDNNQARQSLNAQYVGQSGASSMSKVINGFAKGSGVFILLSISISTFSCYNDFYPALTLALGEAMGLFISFLIGLALAGAIEFFRHLAIRGVFTTTFDSVSRMLIGTIAVLLIVVALVTHYRSLDVFGKLLVTDALQDKNQELAYQRGLTNDNIKELVMANAEVSKGINNGSRADDDNVEAITKSNNKLIETMMVLNGESNKYQTELTIKQSNNMAKTVKGTLFVLFFIIELLAVFGIVSKFLLSRNTDKNVKILASVMDKAQQMEQNVYQALSQNILDNTESKVSQAFDAYKKHQETQKIGNSQELKPKETKILIAPKPKQEETQKTEEIKEDKIPFEPKQVAALDFSTYNHQEQELIRILWNNGQIKKGEYLIPRELVVLDARELMIPRAGSILTNLMDNLMSQGMIERPNLSKGYVAKVALKRELWTEDAA